MSAVPDTFFTVAPHWRWLIICYFFVGGIAGGCYMLAVLADVFGDPGDRRLAHTGYYIAFAAIVLSGLLLTVDLGRPLRFWHMLVQSHTGWPMFKPWSPMSVGSWALLLFGAASFLSFLAALEETGQLRWRGLSLLRPPGTFGYIVGVVGGVLGFFVAGYTGVLLSATNRPIWADTWLLGLTFLVSAASISAALLVLVSYVTGWFSAGVYALKRFDAWALILELLVLAALVASLGAVARIWLSAWGAVLLAMVIIGIVAPLALHWRVVSAGRLTAPIAAVLVLIGGFLLRVVIVLSSEGVKPV
jgi:formate-dependent nitrite reductase membrane component NrfD